MPIHLNSRLSLKVRRSWGVAAVVLLATFAIAAIALHQVRQQLEKSITEDLFQRLSAISDAVDLKFQSRRTLLKTLSDSFESAPPGVPAQVRTDTFPSLAALLGAAAPAGMVGTAAGGGVGGLVLMLVVAVIKKMLVK